MLIQKYCNYWVRNFNEIKLELDIALKGVNYTIEHVGSTAVPNLDSKPIIDIDIIYHTESDLAAIKKVLESLDYFHNGNQGLQHRDVFKRINKDEYIILDGIPHHLYVCLAGTAQVIRHLLMRNYLRQHSWARVAYQNMKYDLANKANQNKKDYQALKEIHCNPFIDEIITLDASILLPTVTTGRLVLRQMREDDSSAIFELRSNALVNQYLDRKPCTTIDETLSFIYTINESIAKNKSYYWVITIAATATVVGTICLYNVIVEKKCCEIGFELLPAYQQQGIMKEAAIAIIDFAQQILGIKKIEAYVHIDNERSAKLLQQSIFTVDDEYFEDNLKLYCRYY